MSLSIIRWAVAAVALVTASGWSGALAQRSPSRDAPVGHRQPKADQIPQEQQATDADKKMKELDEALAKKLNGICRGC